MSGRQRPRDGQRSGSGGRRSVGDLSNPGERELQRIVSQFERVEQQLHDVGDIGDDSTGACGPPALPAGTRWATFDDQQVRFAVASAWIEIKPATMQTAATIPADVKALAKKLGLSATELVKRFDDVDLAYLAMPVGGYSTNLAILSANTGSLPDDEWVKETYSANGKLKILGIERMPTPVGDGMRISASGSVRSMSIAAATIIVDVGRDCVIFEIAGRKRADVDQAAATLLSTLHSI